MAGAGRWRMEAAKRASSSSRPGSGSTVSPRMKKTRERNMPGHHRRYLGGTRMAEVSRLVVAFNRGGNYFWPEGKQYTSCVREANASVWCINIWTGNVDMTQMLGHGEYSRPKKTPLGGSLLGRVYLALELLSGCGMILRARLRTSQAEQRYHRPLRPSVHHSSVIWCNVLNLLTGLHV